MKKLISLAAVVTLAAGFTSLTLSPLPARAVSPESVFALHVTSSHATLPDTATRNRAGSKLNGYREWRFYLTNETSSVITYPSIVVDSGLAPSDFSWTDPSTPGGLVTVTAFPTTMPNSPTSLQPCIDPFDCLPNSKLGDGKGLISTHAVTFTAGYDSTRTVTPTTIPVGGGVQTAVVTVTPRDVRYTSGMTCFDVLFGSNLPGVTYQSSSASDLTTTWPTDNELTNPNTVEQMRLCGPRTVGETYTFTTTYSVPNPYDQAFRFVPEIGINGQAAASPATVDGNSVTILDSTLNGGKGPAFQQGSSTFSVNGTYLWTVQQAVAADVSYSGTNHVPAAPQNVQVAPTSTGAQVTWYPATPGSGGQISGYQLRVYNKASKGHLVVSFQTTETSFGLSTGPALTSGTQYWVEVTAMNPYGTSSPSTPRVPFTLP